MQIISSAPCDFSSRQCIGVSRQPFIMESSPSHPGISVMVGAAAMSSSSTPAWRAAPALRRHCRCGGRASVTSWRRRCHWFGSRTSTRSVVSPPAVSVSSQRHRRWSAAGFDDAAWCRRRPSQCPRGAIVVDWQPGLTMRPGVITGRCFITSLGSAAPPKTNRVSWPSPPLLRLAS